MKNFLRLVLSLSFSTLTMIGFAAEYHLSVSPSSRMESSADEHLAAIFDRMQQKMEKKKKFSILLTKRDDILAVKAIEIVDGKPLYYQDEIETVNCFGRRKTKKIERLIALTTWQKDQVAIEGFASQNGYLFEVDTLSTNGFAWRIRFMPAAD